MTTDGVTARAVRSRRRRTRWLITALLVALTAGTAASGIEPLLYVVLVVDAVIVLRWVGSWLRGADGSASAAG